VALLVSQYIHYIEAKDEPIFYHFMQWLLKNDMF
jgi:hypothetical protein